MAREILMTPPPIARLYAIELTLAVLIADRAASSPNGLDWLRSRRDYILRAIARIEPQTKEMGVEDSLLEVHAAVTNIFAEVENIHKHSSRSGPRG